MTRNELVLERRAVRQLDPRAVVRDAAARTRKVNCGPAAGSKGGRAHIMTVPRRTTLRPNETSPATVKWSTSRSDGIVLKRFWNC